MQRTFETSKLERYIKASLQTKHLSLIPGFPSNSKIQVLNLVRLSESNSNVYSFELHWRKGSIQQRQNFILKAYVQNPDPVLRSYNPSGIDERCLKEFQVLKSLRGIGFPVPEAYLCERNSSLFGFPFIIMSKENKVQESVKAIDSWAVTLARLHNLSLEELHIGSIQSPMDKYAFAKHWPIRYKQFFALASKHDKKLQKYFELAIRWLKSNETYNYCPKYCLIHGDYHPGNAFVTDNSGLIVIDWDDAAIGDSALDVGYVYHFINQLSESKDSALYCGAANRFISEYNRNFNGDNRGRILYYQVVAILELAMFCGLILSNPLTAYRNHGIKAFVSFPFIRSPCATKTIGTSFEVLWIQYFENFIDGLLK